MKVKVEAELPALQQRGRVKRAKLMAQIYPGRYQIHGRKPSNNPKLLQTNVL